MNEIIKVNETKFDGDLVLTVNARDLFNKLGLDKSHLSRWLKKNITENEFAIENIDYIGFAINVEGNIVKEYAITLDLAKKICMLSRTQIGEDVRNYFLRIEKQLMNKKEIREKSKIQRRRFTDTLKEHGYTKQHEYIQTTTQMKKALNIENKKENMTELELKKITAGELIAEINVDISQFYGYHEVNPICINSCKAVNNIIHPLLTE